MKNIFKFIIPCLAAMFSCTSCYDTMDDKAEVDARYESPTSSTISLVSVSAVDFQTIWASGTITNEAEVIEEGVQVSPDANFTSEVTTFANDDVMSSFEVTIGGMVEETTYYVRAYAVTKTAGTIVSEPQTVTTPKAPIFPLDGNYIATEYELNDDDEWEISDEYEITFEFDTTDPKVVYITNIWGGEMTIQGEYDEQTGIVTVPNYSVILVHPSYGDVWMRGVNSSISAYTANIQFKFTALGGKMSSTPWAAQCGAGNFGYYYLTLEHQ